MSIIKKSPSLLIRWGITILTCFLLLMVLLSAFVAYPEMISLPLKISKIDNNNIDLTISRTFLPQINQAKSAIITIDHLDASNKKIRCSILKLKQDNKQGKAIVEVTPELKAFNADHISLSSKGTVEFVTNNRSILKKLIDNLNRKRF